MLCYLNFFLTIIFKQIYICVECESLTEEDNIVTIVDRLLESLHRYKRMEFKPDHKAIRILLEMGFDEKNIVDALKITGNNQINAVSKMYQLRSYSKIIKLNIFLFYFSLFSVIGCWVKGDIVCKT